MWLENDRLNAREAVRGGLVLTTYPRTLVLGLTTRCNLNCIMCGARALGQADMPDSLLETLKPLMARASSIVWSDAGELLASPNVETFLDLMQTYRPAQSRCFTNFTLVEPYLEALLDSGLTEIAISIDATTRATYESIRLGASWDQLLENIERFNRRKKERRQQLPELTFAFVAMKHNIEELPDFVDFAKRHHAGKIAVVQVMPAASRGFDYEAQTLDPQPQKRFCREAIERARRIGILVQDGLWDTWDFLADDISKETDAAPCHSPDRPKEPTASGRLLDRISAAWPRCTSPWSEMLVQTNGKVRPACCLPIILGDLTKKSFWDVWNGHKFQEFRKCIAIQDFSVCDICPLVGRFRRPIDEKRKERFDRFRSDAARRLERTSKKDLLRVMQAAGGGKLWRLSGIPTLVTAFLGRGDGMAERVTAPLLEETIQSAVLEELKLGEDRAALFECLNQLARNLLSRETNGDELPPGPIYDSVDSLVYNVAFLSHATPREIRANQRYRVNVEILNTSTINWPTRFGEHGSPCVRIAYSWYNLDRQLLDLEGFRTELPEENGPFKRFQVEAELKAYQHPGEYLLVWDLVFEKLSWFRDKGATPLEVKVRITE